MVGNWIPTGNDQARLTAQLRGAVNQLTQAAATLLGISNIMSQMVAGGTDYTTVETYFGLQTGTGVTVVPIVGTASTDLQGSNIQGLLQRLG
jgi:hypothetical protein